MENKTVAKKTAKVAKKAVATVTEAAVETGNKAKSVAKNIDFSDSINKVKETADVLNVEIKETATEIAQGVKELGKDIKAVADKNIKTMSEKVDLKNSLDTINAQIKQTAQVIVEEVAGIRKGLTEATTQLANEALDNLGGTERLGIAQVLNTTRKTNKILVKAGTHIFKSSLNTTKSIAQLYKNAGAEALDLGKGLWKETVKLAFDNQKDMRETSVKALKEAVGVIRAPKQAVVKQAKKNAQKEAPAAKEAKNKKQAATVTEG